MTVESPATAEQMSIAHGADFSEGFCTTARKKVMVVSSEETQV